MRASSWLLPISALLVGCTKPNPAVCCTTLEQCQAIEVSDLRPCASELACVDNRCVEPSADASIDSPADAAVDARGAHVFDVAYPKEWTVAVDNSASGYLLIVNTGSNSINLGTLQLKSIVDDDPGTIVLATATPASIDIPPGSAAGYLAPESLQLLVNSALVTEPRSNTTADLMTFGLETVQPHGPGDYDINVQIVVSVGDINIPLQIVVHRLDTQVTYFTPSVGQRAQVFANQ